MKIIKMRPSHRPVIKSMIKVYQPDKVIECGCGPNSTPLWSEGCKEVVGIEHNDEWVRFIQNDVGKNVRFISKQFGTLLFSTYPEALTGQQISDITEWYASIKEPCDLLYVDSFAGTRVYSLIEMAAEAGIVMYHDTEYHKYWYRFFEKKLPQIMPQGFKHYSFRPMVHCLSIDESDAPKGYREIVRQEPSTDIIFRPEHYGKIDEFAAELKKQHEDYYWVGAPFDFVEVQSMD